MLNQMAALRNPFLVSPRSAVWSLLTTPSPRKPPSAGIAEYSSSQSMQCRDIGCYLRERRRNQGRSLGGMMAGLCSSTGDPQVRGLRHRDTHAVILWELADHLEMGNSSLSALAGRY